MATVSVSEDLSQACLQINGNYQHGLSCSCKLAEHPVVIIRRVQPGIVSRAPCRRDNWTRGRTPGQTPYGTSRAPRVRWELPDVGNRKHGQPALSAAAAPNRNLPTKRPRCRSPEGPKPRRTQRVPEATGAVFFGAGAEGANEQTDPSQVGWTGCGGRLWAVAE